MSEVLFEFTVENLETGLRGVPVGYCTTYKVDPKEGLFYVERQVAKLVDQEVEDVIHLIYSKQKGSNISSKDFRQELKNRSALSQDIVESIQKLPRNMQPMHMLSAAVLILDTGHNHGNYREDCLNIIAKAPHLAATVINHHAQFGPTSPPKPELGYMENFSHMLNFPGKDERLFSRIMNMFDILHLDHGGGNLSAFVGKAVASSHQDMYGSLSAAKLALGGPLHGMANQSGLNFVQKALETLGEGASLEQVEEYIDHLVESKELIYGFGHAVLRVEDPRATVFYELAEEYFPQHPLVKMALKLRVAAPNILKKNPKISNPYPNIDAISGTILSAAGFAFPTYFTVLFGMARLVGIAIQIVYERCIAREGKGTPIIRPKYIYKPPV